MTDFKAGGVISSVLVLAITLVGGAASADESSSAGQAAEVEIIEQRFSDLNCTIASSGIGEEIDNCESSLGLDVYVLATQAGCMIAPGKLPENWTPGNPIRHCMPEMFWRVDAGQPVALAYRISQFDDRPEDIALDYYRGTWIITTVGNDEQETCATHNISGIGATSVVLRELTQISFPAACSESLAVIDVN